MQVIGWRLGKVMFLGREREGGTVEEWEGRRADTTTGANSKTEDGCPCGSKSDGLEEDDMGAIGVTEDAGMRRWCDDGLRTREDEIR